MGSSSRLGPTLGIDSVVSRLVDTLLKPMPTCKWIQTDEPAERRDRGKGALAVVQVENQAVVDAGRHSQDHQQHEVAGCQPQAPRPILELLVIVRPARAPGVQGY